MGINKLSSTDAIYVALETAHEFSRPERVQRVPGHVYEHYKNWCFHKICIFTKKKKKELCHRSVFQQSDNASKYRRQFKRPCQNFFS